MAAPPGGRVWAPDENQRRCKRDLAGLAVDLRRSAACPHTPPPSATRTPAPPNTRSYFERPPSSMKRTGHDLIELPAELAEVGRVGAGHEGQECEAELHGKMEWCLRLRRCGAERVGGEELWGKEREERQAVASRWSDRAGVGMQVRSTSCMNGKDEHSDVHEPWFCDFCD